MRFGLVLAGALAGIELGAHDRRVLDWLAGWDTATVLAVASWIRRAVEAARIRTEDSSGNRNGKEVRMMDAWAA
jgi:hypothetical protein